MRDCSAFLPFHEAPNASAHTAHGIVPVFSAKGATMFTQEAILAAPLSELVDMANETFRSSRNREVAANSAPIKIKFGIGRSVFAKAFGFKMAEYFTDPEVCVTTQLRIKLFNFHVMRDDTPFDLDVGLDYATALEPSMFGMESLFEEGKEPTYGAHIIREPEDLDALAAPDFHTSGLMPRAHAMYKDITSLAGGRLRVFFPGWARGPWSIATMLRGFTDLFMDCADDPEYVGRLMQFIVDSRIAWERQRCDFLDIAPTDRDYRWKYVFYRNNYNSDMFEDEVDGNLFSPQMFHDLVAPYTRQLSEFYGGIGYYHSCGNLTDFLPDIATLGIRVMQHISGWTDYSRAAALMPPDVILQISLNATDDVMLADETHMRNRIRSIADNAMGRTVDVCPDALYEGGWDTIDKVRTLIRIFREEVAGQCM